jgi:hypothetical protein
MSEEQVSVVEKSLRRAIWGGLFALGLLLASVGIANLGMPRVFGIMLGLAFIAFSFTAPAMSLAGKMVDRAGAKSAKFWSVWISIASMVVPLVAALFPGIAILSGVPLDMTFGAMIVGPAVGAIINAYVLVSNLASRSPVRGS